MCNFAESECDVIWQLVTIQGFFKGSTLHTTGPKNADKSDSNSKT